MARHRCTLPSRAAPRLFLARFSLGCLRATLTGVDIASAPLPAFLFSDVSPLTGLVVGMWTPAEVPYLPTHLDEEHGQAH